MENLLSIIIPTYNVSSYLTDCMQSVVGKYENLIEILVVDDGSTDNSGQITDHFAEQYPNVTVYHKKNGGLSDARNYGLLRAKGKYVFFLDSDDMVDDRVLAEVMQALSTFDGSAVLWDLSRIDENGSPISGASSDYYIHRGVQPGKQCSGTEIIRQQMEDHRDYLTVSVQGAFSRKMLLSNHLWFEKGLLHEDELWTPKALMACDAVQYLPVCLYRYRVRTDSITTGSQNNREAHIRSLTYIFRVLTAYFDWNLAGNPLREVLKANLARRILHKISIYNAYSYRSAAREIPKLQIFTAARGKKDKIRAAVLLISGKLYCLISGRFNK